MSKKIAFRGEEKRPELHEVLVRVAETATEAAHFLSEYCKAWKLADQGSMWKNLKHREPRFVELMETFHCAMEDFHDLVKENYEARLLAYRIPSIKRWSSNTGRVLWALQVTSRVTNEWLAAHPAEKNVLLMKAVDYFLDRASNETVVAIGAIVLRLHWRFVLTPEERKRLEENDWK